MLLSLMFVLLISVSCSDSSDSKSEFKPSVDQVVGVWHASGDVTIDENSCSISETLLKDLYEYKLTQKSDSDITISECLDDSCTTLNEVGSYPLTTDIVITNDQIVDGAESEYDCKLTLTFKTDFVFSSNTIIDVVDQITNVKKEGTECDEWKTALEEIGGDVNQYFVKLMSDCTFKLSYSMVQK